MRCPICKGKGNIENKGKSYKDMAISRENMVKALLKSGFGTREIARLIGYKSSFSVVKIKSKLK